MANRDTALAILEQINSRKKGKKTVLRRIDAKTWVEVEVGKDVKFKKSGYSLNDGTEHKTKTLKVELNGVVYPNVRDCAESMGMDFRYLYRRLQSMKKNGLTQWSFKERGITNIKFV